MYVPSYINAVNIDLSYRDEAKRIFYFLSEERDIISQLIANPSSTVCGMVVQKLDQKKPFDYDEERLTKWKKHGEQTSAYIGDFAVFCNPARLPLKLSFDSQEDEKNVPKVFILLDFQAYSDSQRAGFIRTFLNTPACDEALLLISSNTVSIPTGFEDEIKLIRVDGLTKNDIRELYKDQIDSILTVERMQPKTQADLNEETKAKERAAEALRGLTQHQILEVLNRTAGSISKFADLAERRKVFDRQIRSMREENAMKDENLTIHDVRAMPRACGLRRYARWLDDRKDAFMDSARATKKRGIRAPKGVLVVGIPGTGKTAMAAETARRLSTDTDAPLSLLELRIDMLDSKWHGESGALMRRYLEKANSMAPCVMLIDEIEKSFRQDSNGSQSEARIAMMGILLKWMQERKKNVFTFITANNVDNLPPELLRDGRLSERFFAFLPTCDDLAAIMWAKLVERAKWMGFIDVNGQKIRQIDDCGILDLLVFEDGCLTENHQRICSLFDEIAEYAEEKRVYKFFTGANIEKLIDDTNLLITKEENRNKNYRKMLQEIAQEMVTQGETSMKKMIQMWFVAKENQFGTVDDNFFFPFKKYIAAENDRERLEEKLEAAKIFEDCGKRERKYDCYMFQCVCTEIDRWQEHLDQEEKIRRKAVERGEDQRSGGKQLKEEKIRDQEESS